MRNREVQRRYPFENLKEIVFAQAVKYRDGS